jgi:hypothetical protein
MTTAYTSLLGLALPVTGELSGTWGDTVNNSITSLLDTSVAGTTNVSADSNVTLTTTTGASNQARQAILLFSGARTAIRTVTAPAQSKIYTVINATTGGYAVTLVGAGPTTGVTIANGARTVVAWNGSDFVEVSSPSSIILPGGTANGVLYLNGSKVVTSGSALVFDGSNLGVGITPAERLHIFKSTYPIFKIESTSYNSTMGIDTGNGNLVITNASNAAMQFATNNTERMRLDASGNFMLGATSTSTRAKIVGAANNDCVLKLETATNNYASGLDLTALNSNGAIYNSIRSLSGATEMWYVGGGGAASNTLVFKTGGTEQARITSDGNLLVGTTGGSYRFNATVASGADRDMLLAGVSGVTNGFQINYINSSQTLAIKFNSIPTTASAANAHLDSADGNRIYRSTSSLRYKTDVETIETSCADAVLNLRPVWYRSTADSDKKDWSWYGLIAEEVAEVEPRLVHWSYLDSDYECTEENGQIKKTLKDGATLVPDGVQYERVSVLLLDVVKRQGLAIQEQQAIIESLKARLDAANL